MDAGPRPGTPCVYCRGPIAMNEKWLGGKGDYWHQVCYENNLSDQMFEAKKLKNAKTWNKAPLKVNQYGEYERTAYDDYAYNDDYAYEEDRQHADGYNVGYNVGYEHGVGDGKLQNSHDIESIRVVLDTFGVPAQVDKSYGPGQAGRLAWFLDRQGYVIQEIGNPDALK